MIPQPSTEYGTGERFTRWGRRSAAVGFLVVLYASVAGLKVHAEHGAAPGFFKEEFALQYRYARLIAQGNQVPRHDRKLQYPDGVRPYETMPLFMEHIVGYGHRYARWLHLAADFDEVLIGVKALWSSLSVVACFVLARQVFRADLPAAAASLVYGLAPASLYRSIPSLAHEDFALPLLFGGVAGIFASLRAATAGSRFIGAALAGMLWSAALLTWHFTRFFLIAEASMLLVLLVIASDEMRRRLQTATAVTVATLAGASFLFEHLRSTAFLLSLSFWLLLSVPAVALAVSRCESLSQPSGRLRSRWRSALVAASVLVAFTVILWLGQSGSLYGHVRELLWAKLTHWGGKPADPSALSFDARVLWSGSFHAPELSLFVFRMWAPLLAAAIALVRLPRVSRAVNEPDNRDALALVLLEAFVFVLLALLVSRLEVFAVFFLSVLGGGLAIAHSRLQRRVAFVALGVFAIVLTCNYPGVSLGGWLRLPVPTSAKSAAQRFQPISQLDQSLFRWIALETPVDAVFAGRFNTLPPVLTYADRAIVLHSKFEVPGIRGTVEAHFRSLFGSEDELAAFCDRHGATHYLHDPFTVLDTGVHSARYMAGLLRVPKNSAAFALQFAPERLRRFELVYQNALYRVYRRTDHPKPFDPAEFPSQVIYDPVQFGSDQGGDFFSDAGTERVLQALQRGNERLRSAVALFTGGRWLEADGLYQEALRLNPSLPYAHSHRARILLELGWVSEALDEANAAVWFDPFEPEGWFHRALIQSALGDHTAARQSLATCRRIDPAFPGLPDY